MMSQLVSILYTREGTAHKFYNSFAMFSNMLNLTTDSLLGIVLPRDTC